jgi:hypothetical protein
MILEGDNGSGSGGESNGGGGESPASEGGGGPQSAEPGVVTPQGEAAGGTPPPTYTPNFKFRYAKPGATNEQVEGEFDDFLKPVVKDAETEKKIREIYAKAHGLEFVQADRDRFKPYAEKYDTLVGNLQRVTSFAQKGDFQSFFDALQIPEKSILQYALERVQYHKLDPQQRAQLDEQRQQSQRASALELQNQQLQQNLQHFAVQQRTVDLDQELARPDISATIQNFDTRVGKPGAFKKLVIERGQNIYFNQGVDMPPGQVVMDVLNMIGAPATPGQAAPGRGAGGAQTPAPKPPVLPNVSGKGSSPVKTVYKSTDALRQRAAELAAQAD